MTHDLQQRISSAHQQWLDLNEEERSTFMSQLQQSDPEVAVALSSRLDVDTIDQVTPPPDEVDTGDHTPFTLIDDLSQYPNTVGRYRVLGLVGRGGMGIVLRVHDDAFDRPLAIKMMLAGVAQDADVQRRRFLDEARLTGQLQHPGIPPAHELGQLDEQTPYFVMKLIEGKTLTKVLLSMGTDVDAQRLGIFIQICHTLGYAHSQGVIHRDLKPSNIMVGAFGEVQVMDWGLAKTIATLTDEDNVQVNVNSLKIDDDMALSHTGQVMGTPGYMAPEQARGEIRSLDSRCDVFGLGAILCKMLTGKPPFTGNDVVEVMVKSMDGNLEEAFDRLDACGADTELIDLCKSCLSANATDRPANGSELATALEAYEATLQQRLRDAELAKAEAEVRAVEEQKRQEVERRKRRWTLFAAVAILLLFVSGAGGLLWYQSVTAAREAEQTLRLESIRDAIDQAVRLRKELHNRLTRTGGVFQLLDTPRDWLAHIEAREASWKRASDLAQEREIPAQLQKQIDQVKEGIAQDRQDYQFTMQLERVREDRSIWIENDFDYERAYNEYPRVFAQHGINVLELPEEKVIARLRPLTVREFLAVALDDWALSSLQQTTKENLQEQKQLRERLLHISRSIDPHSWKNRLREPSLWHTPKRLLAFRDEAMKASKSREDALFPPQTYSLLASLLNYYKVDNEAWLRKGQSRYRSDYWLAFELAIRLYNKKNYDEAVGLYRTALARRPSNVAALTNLGVVFHLKGDLEKALSLFREAIALNPREAKVYHNLGVILNDQGNWQEAIKKYQKAIEFDPKLVESHFNLGVIFEEQNDLDSAIDHFQKAIHLNPKLTRAYDGLGSALRDRGDVDGAIAQYREALRLDPNLATVHNDLALALRSKNDADGAIKHFRKAVELNPKLHQAHANLALGLQNRQDIQGAIKHYQQAVELGVKHPLVFANYGLVLHRNGDVKGAIVQYKKALQLDPNNAFTHRNFANALRVNGDVDGAITHYRLALQRDPNNVLVLHHLGATLNLKGELKEAIQLFRKAIQLNPGYVSAQFNLGVTLEATGDVKGAIEQFKKTIQLDRKHFLAYANLGLALRPQGKLSESSLAFENASKHLPPNHPAKAEIEKLIKQTKHWHDLKQKLADILQGNDTNAQEQVEAANLCLLALKRHRDAVQLYQAAFATESKLAAMHRYDAACAAVLAIESSNKKEQTKLRGLALDWLREGLKAFREQSMQGNAKAQIRSKLQHWMKDKDLANVRDEKSLAMLPEAERKAWQTLWTDVTNLLRGLD